MAPKLGRSNSFTTTAVWTSSSMNRLLIAAVIVVAGPLIVFDGYSRGGIYGMVICVLAIVAALSAHCWAEGVRRRQSKSARENETNH